VGGQALCPARTDHSLQTASQRGVPIRERLNDEIAKDLRVLS
jgi:hypothetical protein